MKKLLFSTNYNLELAKSVVKKSKMLLGNCEISRFKDQEISVLIKEDVEGQKVYVMGATPPPGDNILEILILIHTLKANGAKEVHVILPYLAYAKADHVYPKGATLSAKLIAEMLEASGADSVAVVNIHSDLAENFFNIPVSNLDGCTALAGRIKKEKIKDLVIVSPDFGGVERAKIFDKAMGNGGDVVIIRKYRPEFDEVKVLEVIGDVKGKNLVIIDDLIQSGGTTIEAANILKKNGAKDIYVAVIHLLFSGPGISLLQHNKNIKKVFYCDTVISDKKLPVKFERISVDGVISKYLLTKKT